MSVIVKGMKKPKNCDWCPFFLKNRHDRGDDSLCRASLKEAKDGCPLIEIPTDDVAPVVRCKDCKNADFSGMGNGTIWCMEMERAMQEDNFCSRGARMDGEA